MSGYGPDPFEAGQREALRATDALLDRIGSRAPTPEDLDDPLVAALALMAAEIDLDGVPVELTRAALEQHLGDLDLAGPPRSIGVPHAVADEPAALVIDLRDVPAAAADPTARERMRRRPPGAAPAHAAAHDGELRHPRRTGRSERAAATGPIAPPRSLPRTRPGTVRPEGRRERRLTPGTAFVAVIAALVLGIGVSAAVTGGRSVNPLTGLQQVVAQLTGGRTAEQSVLFDTAQADLDAAAGAVDRGDSAQARAHLRDYLALDLSMLTTDDQHKLAGRLVAIQQRLAR